MPHQRLEVGYEVPPRTGPEHLVINTLIELLASGDSSFVIDIQRSHTTSVAIEANPVAGPQRTPEFLYSSAMMSETAVRVRDTD